jgi:predicted MFS family arabinose efflux permease
MSRSFRIARSDVRARLADATFTLQCAVQPPSTGSAVPVIDPSDNRGNASGTYLACYFFGGLVGSAVLGQLFDRFGWTACVAGVGASLAIAALLTARLTLPRSAGSPA